MKQPICNGCPFNDGFTEEACLIQNYGCLPDKFDILAAQDYHQEVWHCHAHEDRVCGGLLSERPHTCGKAVRPSKLGYGEGEGLILESKKRRQ